jgi:hypothetical protein
VRSESDRLSINELAALRAHFELAFSLLLRARAQSAKADGARNRMGFSEHEHGYAQQHEQRTKGNRITFSART